MSKERARRRAEREREAGIRAVARAQQQERRERRAARKRALTRRLPRWGTGRQTGILAKRRRKRTTFLACLIVVLNALLWFATDGWAPRFGGVLVSVLAAPVLYTLLFRSP